MRLSPRRSDEQGSTLVLTLVFMTLFGVLVAALLSFADTGINLHDVQEARTNQLYAADNAVEWATKVVQDNKGRCPSDLRAGRTLRSSDSPPAIAFPQDVSELTVRCRQYTGPGSNVFGGYAVVAGTKYAEWLRTKNYQKGFRSLCDSFSTDPVGSTFGKKGTEGDRCRTFPADASAAPLWTPLDPPDWADDPTVWVDCDLSQADCISGEAFWKKHEFMDATTTDAANWWYGGTRKNRVSGADQMEPFVYWGSDNDDFIDFSGVPTASGTNPSLREQKVSGKDVKAVTRVWANRIGAVGSADETRFGVWAVTSEADDSTAKTSALWTANLRTEAVDDDPANAQWSQITGLTGSPSLIYDVFGYDDPNSSINDRVFVIGRYSNDKDAVWTGTSADGSWSAATITWTRSPDVPNDTPAAGWTPDGVRLYLVGGADSWYLSGTPAATWVKKDVPDADTLVAIDGFVEPGGTVRAWAVARKKKHVFRLSDAATNTWASTKDVLSGNARSLTALDADYMWVGETNKRIYNCPVPAACVSEGIDPDWTPQKDLVAGASASLLNPDGTPVLNPNGEPTVLANFFAIDQGDDGKYGGDGTAPLTYSPSFPVDCGDTCRAYIGGGPVFNAMDVNLASPLSAPEGFQQLKNPSSSASCASASVSTTPRYLLSPTAAWTCLDSIPSAITDLSFPLPTAVPPTSPTNGGREGAPKVGTGSGTCNNLRVWLPGTYTTKVKFPKNTYNFLVSGVYNFAGGFKGIDNGRESTRNPNALWIVGGQPMFGEAVTVADPSTFVPAAALTTVQKKATDCWSAIRSSNYCPLSGTDANLCNATNGTGRNGTGVELILSKNSKWDIKTANVELFTRSDPTGTRPEGLSIRESCRVEPSDVVAVTTIPNCPAAWTTYANTLGDRVMFKVKKKDRRPLINIHGGLYLPSHNVQELTTTQGVVLGPLYANSVELAFAKAESPATQVSGGSPLTPTVVITVTTGGTNPHTVEAFVPYAATQQPGFGRYTGTYGVFRIDDPAWTSYKTGWGRDDTRTYTWRVLTPTS
ncbi:MAG: type II secretion system protein [Actinomycetota bacterium]